MTIIRGVLFDLDGTLLDTAPDLLTALNLLREEQKLPLLDLPTFKCIANLGSKAMIELAYGVDQDAEVLQTLRKRFLTLYEQNIAQSTQLFPQIEEVLTHLEMENIPWGIVTNKLTRHTHDLLKALRLDHRPACVICGDSLPTHKPDPAPILHACSLIGQKPENCLYIGDASTDVTASKAAGTTALVALYGYINRPQEDPYAWKADGYIEEAIEIIQWLNISAD